MKKIIITAIGVSILLTGCWDLNEPEKLGMVTLMGVDAAGGGQVRVIIHELAGQKKDSGSPGSGSGGSGKETAESHEAVASTVADAVEKISATSFHLINFSHTYVVVISEELAGTSGIRPVIDFMERNPVIRRNIWVLVAEKGTFEKVCDPDIFAGSSTGPGRVISDVIRNKSASSIISALSLGDFLNLAWERGGEPYTAGIRPVEASGRAGNRGSGSEDPKYTGIKVENTAVFRSEKLAGWLDENESKGLQLAKGNPEGGTLTVGFENGNLSFRITKCNAEIKPMIVDGKMEATLLITIESNLMECQTNLNLTDSEVMNRIQRLQADQVKMYILSAYEKSKQFNADIFEFGNYFFGKYPEVWKQIEKNKINYYGNIKVKVEVISKVNNIGLVKKAAGIKVVD